MLNASTQENSSVSTESEEGLNSTTVAFDSFKTVNWTFWTNISEENSTEESAYEYGMYSILRNNSLRNAAFKRSKPQVCYAHCFPILTIPKRKSKKTKKNHSHDSYVGPQKNYNNTKHWRIQFYSK